MLNFQKKYFKVFEAEAFAEDVVLSDNAVDFYTADCGTGCFDCGFF